jgi:hypothetical protein
MKRVLKDGLYRDEREEAGGSTIVLMYLMAFLIGAALAVFVFFYIFGRRYYAMSHLTGLEEMNMEQAKGMLAGVAIVGGLVGLAVLFGWRQQYKEETQQSASRPREDPHKNFFDSLK